MERAVFVYTTWPSPVEAEAAGRSLCEQRLAACVNILPGIVSFYRWEGQIERGQEAVMLVKTRAALVADVERAVRALHPDQVPAILVLPLEHVEASYLSWLFAQTGDAAPGAQD